MSPKFPEIFSPRRTLVFAGSLGVYPTSVNQQFCGPLRPLCALARPGLSPGSASRGQRSPPRHTPWPSRPLRTALISLEFQLQTQAKLSLLDWHALLPGEERALGLVAAPGRPPETTPDRVSAQLWRPPSPSPPQNLASRGRSQGNPGKPLRLMRLGAFVLLSLPPLRS